MHDRRGAIPSLRERPVKAGPVVVLPGPCGVGEVVRLRRRVPQKQTAHQAIRN
jgi:hypothetical protein